MERLATPQRLQRPLNTLFAPKSVAVIGATDKPASVGRTLLWNLISNPFGGTVYAINPNRHSVLGIKAYPNLAAIDERVELAIIVTPAKSVPGIVDECVAAGVSSAIVISAGFKETGESGVALEQDILRRAQEGGLRIVGPNCLGIMCPVSGLNATFASGMAQKGSVGFISQSGALCTSILDWSFQVNVGFSAFISTGSMLDVDWGDLIFYLGDDPNTKAIVIYMESIGNARSFLSAAREVALTKPIIVIKSGQTEQAAKAAASHTGALAGSDEVLSAAFRRSGVSRVYDIESLFHMAEVLGKQPRPRGPRLTILTNAGGPGVLATDAVIRDGGSLAELTEETRDALDKVLPAHWSHNNPIDILGDADPARYAKALEIAANDTESDGLLVVLTPQAMTDPTSIAQELCKCEYSSRKPVLASWMGGAEVEAGIKILNENNIPTFPYPDVAARMFNYMWRYNYNIRGLYETPSLISDEFVHTTDPAKARAYIEAAYERGDTLLSEYESKALLRTYGIPVTEAELAGSTEAAVAAAKKIGFPVVLKLHSTTLTHKTDVGGVQLNLQDGQEVEAAFLKIQKSVSERAGAEHFMGVIVQPMIKTDGYELIIGSSIDPQFGPVLLFGSGGQLVEVYGDRSLALPPLNTTLARRMMEQTKIYKALKGVRGRKPIPMELLEQLMVKFSILVAEQRRIAEIDINPLLVSPEGLIALDARVVLHPREKPDSEIPKLAIRPYPRQYVHTWTMKDKQEVTIRPIRPEDEPLMVEFHKTLSENTVYYRYLGMMSFDQRVRHERLTRMCFIDYDREIALVADHYDANSMKHHILAVARFIKFHATNRAEYAIVVGDDVQQLGLGQKLMTELIEMARKEGVGQLVGTVSSENRGMLHICQQLGFELHKPVGEPVQVVLNL